MKSADYARLLSIELFKIRQINCELKTLYVALSILIERRRIFNRGLKKSFCNYDKRKRGESTSADKRQRRKRLE